MKDLSGGERNYGWCGLDNYYKGMHLITIKKRGRYLLSKLNRCKIKMGVY
jgi:hypothetical protein